MKEVPSKNKLIKEITEILNEQNINYHHKVVESLKDVVQNLTIKILKDAAYYKGDNKDLNKNDILLAISLDKENRKCVEPLPMEDVLNLTQDYNCIPISIKEAHGLRIPKENLGNCNYQLENPNKKLKLDAANKFENYGNKQFGNCFTFLMPPKYYKPPNMGGFVIKNQQAMRESPMKITIRPKFNLQQNVSMLKKNNNQF